MADLRAKVESGEISQDSLDCRHGVASEPDGWRSGRSAPQADAPERRSWSPGVEPGPYGAAEHLRQPPARQWPSSCSLTPRLELRPVLMGVNDWDNTEILAGLQEGEMVALIGVAQLMAEQEDMRTG